MLRQNERSDHAEKTVIPEGFVGNLRGNGSPIKALGDDLFIEAVIVFSKAMFMRLPCCNEAA